MDFGNKKDKKPKGKENWFKRAKLRNTLQIQKKKYQAYFISRFCNILKGSRLIRKRLKKLDIGKRLSEAEKEFFNEMFLNREKTIVFE